MRGTARVAWMACAAMAGLAGCSGDTTGPKTRDEVAVFAYLYVGEPIDGGDAITVTRVRPIDEAYDPDEAAVRGAIVTLRRKGAAPETLAMGEPGRYANPAIVIDSITANGSPSMSSRSLNVPGSLSSALHTR